MYKQPTFTSEGKEDKEASGGNLEILKAFESLVVSPEDVIIKLRQKFHLTPHCGHWFNVSDNEAGFAVNIKSKIISNSGKMPGEGFGFVIASPAFSYLPAYSLPL